MQNRSNLDTATPRLLKTPKNATILAGKADVLDAKNCNFFRTHGTEKLLVAD